MIIAEVGLNHLGKGWYVDEYINELLNTSVDAITFQVREPEYYKDKKKDLLLSNKTYTYIANRIHQAGKKFGIAIGSFKYIDFFESIDVDFYKVIRNDITNLALIDKLSDTEKLVIVSTGLSSEKDIDSFINHIGNNRNFRLNHTQLSYTVQDCNLRAIKNMKDRYNLDISFGSHCSNHNVLYLALAYDPSDILFYVKLDIDQIFPDDKHAVFLKDVKDLIHNLKTLPLAIGSGEKLKMENKIKDNYEKSDSISK